MYSTAISTTNPLAPSAAIFFDETICTSCNICVNVCHMGILLPNKDTTKPPVVMYPEECWFCGVCVAACPLDGAIRMEHPLNQAACWKRKETGEFFRIGMNNPPTAVNNPPVGE